MPTLPLSPLSLPVASHYSVDTESLLHSVLMTLRFLSMSLFYRKHSLYPNAPPNLLLFALFPNPKDNSQPFSFLSEALDMADSHACKIISAKRRSRVPHSACFIFASLLHSLPPLSQHGPYNLMFFRLLATSRRTMSSYFLLGFPHLNICSLGLNPSSTVYSTSEIVSIG